MLLDDRPATVNVQDVVRDAMARLPQGVGTKGDVMVLLQDSQYVDPMCPATMVASHLSDCLDRLSAMSDPVASYSGPSRLWSYLHRNRSPEELQ